MSQSKENFAMTQQEIADTLGMDRTTVNYIERLAIEKLKAVLDKRGIKVSDFLEIRE
jgi:DNA-binding XRE family transcriptional regulator